MTTLLQPDPDVLYPESDGLPLADNTIQFRLIATTQGGLDALFRHEKVFVAGDLLWYPVEHSSQSKGPDVMVVFGRDKGDRRSYQQWKEDNIPPQVVFEFVSKNNSITEVEGAKLDFYQQHGVEEYYVHDPERGTLKGWLRQGETLQPIAAMTGWISPRLSIRFELIGKEMQLYSPNGERFATYPEIVEQREQERQLRKQAESKLDALSQRLKTLDPEQLQALGIDPEMLS